MNAIVEFLTGSTCQHLAMALLHTLWQGLTVAVLLWMLLRRIPADRPESRYWAAFSALMGLVLCGLVTWSVLDLDWPQSAASADAPMEAVSRGESEEHVALADKQPVPPASHMHPVPAHRPTWLALVMAGWLLGVALMTGRMVWMVARLRRFAGGPEVADGRIRQLVDELRQVLHLTRPLRVVETAEEFGPAVLGIVRPLLALPISMMTGLPPDAVRAIVAHELAHIRRHDYLLNLVQMVIEAVLFFNPAVWWINRQIRIEREACCDAMAAGVVGQPLVLAEALSLWAERAFARSAPAAAFAETGRHGPRLLLDRIRRMVLPGYRPQTPISPVGFVGFFLTGVLVLAALSCGTSAIVELAAKALTPAQRMEQIVETQQHYAPPEATSPEGKVTLSGTIRTHDGQPLPEKIYANEYTFSRFGSTIGALGELQRDRLPEFSVTTGSRQTWLQFEAEDYAPAIVGPFSGKAGDTISGIEIVLGPGFPLMVRVTDEDGKPIEGVTVTASPIVNGGSWRLIHREQVTNADGTALFPHAVEREYYVSAARPGFQPIPTRTVPIKPDQPLALTMLCAQPVRGVVLSPEGRPVSEAQIQIAAEFRTGGGNISGDIGPVRTVTDADGRFALDELDENATYSLLISTETHGRCLFDGVCMNKPEFQIKLGPEMTVSGTVHGDLDKLKQADGKPIVEYSESVNFAPHCSSTVGGKPVPVESVDREGRFTLRNLLPGELCITSGEYRLETIVSASNPHKQVTLDLTRPPILSQKRQIVMRFATPDGTVPPEGAIEVTTLKNADDRYAMNRPVPLEAGVARFDASTSVPLSYTPEGMLGYWFERGNRRIEPGHEPLEITVPVVPAGAIAGQVLNVDGTPAVENVSINTNGSFTKPNFNIAGGFSGNMHTNAKGMFFVTPLPLGGTYTVYAMRGYTLQCSEPVQPDAAHPTANITLQLPPTSTVEGTVLDPEGRPAVGLAYDMGFSCPAKQFETSWGGNYLTDAKGQFRFADLSVGVGEYTLRFHPRRDFRALHMALPSDGKPLVVQLQRGLVLEGRVLESDTGRPLPDETVYAMSNEYPLAQYDRLDAEAPTDAEGRFRFSNLNDCTYQIWDSRGGVQFGPDVPGWKPGEKSVVVRVAAPHQQ